MILTYWMYEGPAHIGTLRIASSFKKVHAIMHGPLGDDYFNVMKSMLERKRDFTPITTSVVDRHVLARGSQEKVIKNIIRKDKEEKPDLVVLTPTCTSSILQEDLNNFVQRSAFETKADVLLADVNHYRVTESQAADRTLLQIVKFYLNKLKHINKIQLRKSLLPSVNIIGSLNLAFHNQHDIAELKRLLSELGIEINLVVPEGTSVDNIKMLPQAWFNIVLYREVGLLTAEFLENEFSMPYTSIAPIGVIETARFIRKIAEIINMLSPTNNINFENYIDIQTRFVSQSAWFSRSIDCQNLIGKRAVVFGDSTHSAAITKILVGELGIQVLFAGTYNKYDQFWFESEVEGLCEQTLITSDHTLVANLISQLMPSAIFGTQMERHVGKRLNIPCGVISAPVHIQNFPLSYRPFVGYEGANQIADLIYNSFTLGMEDHLLEIFGGHDIQQFDGFSKENQSRKFIPVVEWSSEAKKELENIPNFVRGKVKENTEKFALSKEAQLITLDVIYQAKESFKKR
uniref:Light-independent protochlorophyllide reductase subunit B n=1 Tax=Haramonas pauciplastida TaxID=478668 RepID=UPI002115879B|nr:Light-independent protochlorophyllide reductase subunit B [Haramonas pauciplastida]UTE95015.1 Light-independent protochlorophyllide reductase subunit B [Haramonas pauciplastida]